MCYFGIVIALFQKKDFTMELIVFVQNVIIYGTLLLIVVILISYLMSKLNKKEDPSKKQEVEEKKSTRRNTAIYYVQQYSNPTSIETNYSHDLMKTRNEELKREPASRTKSGVRKRTKEKERINKLTSPGHGRYVIVNEQMNGEKTNYYKAGTKSGSRRTSEENLKSVVTHGFK